jgi:hypothetical protein
MVAKHLVPAPRTSSYRRGRSATPTPTPTPMEGMSTTTLPDGTNKWDNILEMKHELHSFMLI